ncbi:MAG: GDP-mannose 4,6-dehydratase [Planctomycetes bacterium]|nr:GDP-mannose 4,6-dehydratase [Planctomycetota bacterium]
MTKIALITGVTGQDGSYLSDFLLAKGYEVHGIIRRSSSFNTQRIQHLFRDLHDTESKRFQLHYGDMLDSGTLSRLVESIGPDEIYNLAAQSHVRVSFDLPTYTANTVYLGTLRLLEAIRRYSKKEIRLYQASSSEMFGGASEGPYDESTPLDPRSPYAVAKVAAYHQCRNYREAYDLYVASGILFNHESPRRGETFVTRKITYGLAKILAGLEDHLYLGNLAAKRDWGYAGDYVRAMWMMLQQDTPDDFVIATGESHSVQNFLDLCCSLIDRDPKQIVRIDPRYFRPTEVDVLTGDASKARRVLGWKPEVSYDQLTALMLATDLRARNIDLEPYPRLRALVPDSLPGPDSVN